MRLLIADSGLRRRDERRERLAEAKQAPALRSRGRNSSSMMLLVGAAGTNSRACPQGFPGSPRAPSAISPLRRRPRLPWGLRGRAALRFAPAQVRHGPAASIQRLFATTGGLEARAPPSVPESKSFSAYGADVSLDIGSLWKIGDEVVTR